MSVHSEDPPSGRDASSPTAPKKRKAALGEIEVDLALPEPPSKKARRAVKKGKALPANGTKDEDGDGDKKASRKKPASEHGVWIGNLPFTTTKADLRRWLVDNSGGAIDDEAITRVHIPTVRPEKKKGKDKDKDAKKEDEDDGDGDGAAKNGAVKPAGGGNRGFAYVDFATFAASVAAVALSETAMGGRKLLIKNSTNFEGRPAPPKPVDGDGAAKAGGAADSAAPAANGKNAAVPGATKIFVGNLGFSTTEDELAAHFEKCGPIRWVKVATFEDTGKCKGYGWVNFQDAEAAAWAAQGFVRIRETVDTIEDFMDEGDTREGEEDEEESAEDEATAGADGDGEKKGGEKRAKKAQRAQAAPKTKTRKWWVNQLHGRPLKIELAEDDKVRYKKRFGKGAQRPQSRPAAAIQDGEAEQTTADGGSADAAERPAAGATKGKGAEKKSALNFHEDISVARLTGAAVKPQGKKVTFD